jgi:hypothetical protein
MADTNPTAQPLSKEFVERYAKSYTSSPRYELIDRCKTFSMLHHETLLLLNFFARRVPETSVTR